MANVIYAGEIGKEAQYAEALAGAAGLLPGQILIKTAGAFVAHDADGQGGPLYIANKDTLSQANVGDAYEEGDTVQAFNPRPADFFYLRVATGQNITALDTPLTSNGAGELRIAVATGADEVIGYAQKVVNLTTAGGLVLVKIATSGYNALGGA